MKYKKIIWIVGFVFIGGVIGGACLFWGKQDYTMYCQEIKCNKNGSFYACAGKFIRCANNETICYQYKNKSYEDGENFCFKK